MAMMLITIQTRIPDGISDKFKASYGDQIKKMSDRLDEEVLVQNALKGFANGSQSRPTGADGNGNGNGPPRTSASPEWLGEYPWNFRKRLPLTGISIADFESGNSLLEEKQWIGWYPLGMWSTRLPRKITMDVFIYRSWYVFIFCLKTSPLPEKKCRYSHPSILVPCNRIIPGWLRRPAWPENPNAVSVWLQWAMCGWWIAQLRPWTSPQVNCSVSTLDPMSRSRQAWAFHRDLCTCVTYWFKLAYLIGINLWIRVNPAATAASATETLPWCLSDDKALVCLVKTENGNVNKSICSVADLMCSITRDRGVTEVRLVDHDMSPMLKAPSWVKKWMFHNQNLFETCQVLKK